MNDNERKKLIASAYSAGLKKPDKPNILKDLLQDFTEIDRKDLYMIYSYFSAGVSLRTINTYFRHKTSAESLKKLVIEKFS